MVANIRNMEIDNDTQNGITAMRVYGESLKGYMMQEAMASLHCQNGDVILDEILWRLYAGYRETPEAVVERVKDKIESMGQKVEDMKILAAGVELLDKDQFFRNRFVGEVADMFVEKGYDIKLARPEGYVLVNPRREN